jgi:hypothetical protein
MGATHFAQYVVGFDAMTQRFEITCLLQRALVNDPAVFGQCLSGSPAEPAVRMESVHYLLKEVAGVPSRRPVCFFDLQQQGEALADVGTHLVDLVQWTLFPDQPVQYQQDINVLDGKHWPTILTRDDFQRVTGEPEIPATMIDRTKPVLKYYANNSVLYTLRGIHVALTVRWEFTPEPGGNHSETAVYRGSRSRIEVQQGPEQRFKPEVYVVPNEPAHMARVQQALDQRIRNLQRTYPGLSFAPEAARLHVLIPDRYRVGHEQHFALLTRQFVGYVRAPGSRRNGRSPTCSPNITSRPKASSWRARTTRVFPGPTSLNPNNVRPRLKQTSVQPHSEGY